MVGVYYFSNLGRYFREYAFEEDEAQNIVHAELNKLVLFPIS